ncbi:MAG: glutamate racemase [Maricaulaceae bacterium]|jgi:glutamate racemase
MSAGSPSQDAPSCIVFDSGFGGLSIVAAMRALGIGGRLIYAADHAGFPYGARSEADVAVRVREVVGAAIDVAGPQRPAAVVIACNTASTLALPLLRATWDMPFVGTVPAIKPAAAATRSGLFSVLATPETVRRDYTRALIGEFAAERDVTLVGAARLAEIAEAVIHQLPEGARAQEVARQIAEEIAPAFVERDGARTDAVVLGCTHFPLIAKQLKDAAPWPVAWIDPSEAIARRLGSVAPGLSGAPAEAGELWSTRPPAIGPALRAKLAAVGLSPEPHLL